jgi:hypothetical protein
MSKSNLPDSRLKCLCGLCNLCRSRKARRRVAEGKRTGVPYVGPRTGPRRVKGDGVIEHALNNHGGWDAVISRQRQEAMFVWLNERFAARVAGVIGG